MEDGTSQELHRNILSVNLWKNQHLENIDESPNFSEVSSKMYWMWTSEKFHTKKISMKDQTSQELHRNVLSIDLWKIPHLENFDERPNFSRVSLKMYQVWNSEKLRTWKISMEVQTSQEFHRKCTECGPLKIPHSENNDKRQNSSRVSSKMY